VGEFPPEGKVTVRRVTQGAGVSVKPFRPPVIETWELSVFNGFKLVTTDFPSQSARDAAASKLAEFGVSPIYLTVRFKK
jgi:hypothetical protein